MAIAATKNATNAGSRSGYDGQERELLKDIASHAKAKRLPSWNARTHNARAGASECAHRGTAHEEDVLVDGGEDAVDAEGRLDHVGRVHLGRAHTGERKFAPQPRRPAMFTSPLAC
eukprot:6180865-Pleurochrysis_carterae.AAC.1